MGRWIIRAVSLAWSFTRPGEGEDGKSFLLFHFTLGLKKSRVGCFEDQMRFRSSYESSSLVLHSGAEAGS